MKVVQLLLSGVTALVLLMPAAALAHNGESHATEREARTHEATAAAREQAQTRQGDQRKLVCEERANNIQALIARSVKRAENFGQFFDTMTQRLTNFVENQDQVVDPQLLDAVAQAQAQFKTDLATMQDKAVFSCDVNNPKEQIIAFQQAHRQVLQDLKTWRTALKNLIDPFKPSEEAA